jgi:hypothetical protein
MHATIISLPSGADILEHVVSGVVLVVILLLAAFRNKLVESAYDALVRRKLQDHFLNDRDGTRMDLINTLMEQSLYALEATRACVIQFHNGDVFALANPAWKLTCTVERHVPGSLQVQDSIRDIPVTWWSDMISPMLSDTVSTAGVTPREHGVPCRGCPIFNDGLRKVLRHEYKKMPVSQATLSAAANGQEMAYTVNLVNQKQRAVIGFLLFQFRSVPDLDETDKRVCLICENARRIEAALTLENKAEKTGLWKSLTKRIFR